MYFNLGSIDILTILSILIQEHKMFSHLFRSLISFSIVLHFLLCRSATSLVKFIPKYFTHFVTIVNGIVSFTSDYPLLVYRCGEGNGTPLQYFCLENPMDGGAWQAAVHGVAKSWTVLSNFTFTFHLHALEKEMATHSSVLAWRIPGTAEPGGLPSIGSHRVGHD